MSFNKLFCIETHQAFAMFGHKHFMHQSYTVQVHKLWNIVNLSSDKFYLVLFCISLM